MKVDTEKIPKRWVARGEELFRNMEAAVKRGAPLSLAPYAHADITIALRWAAYCERFAGKQVKLEFDDGSTSLFPVGVLRAQERASYKHPHRLRVGLMSFRHPELDFLVDQYVCRNRELADQVAMSEQEDLSRRNSFRLLHDIPSDTPINVDAYHTGLEPMVVGFYRGVVEELLHRNGNKKENTLCVSSHLFNVARGEEPYTPESPGARDSDYVLCALWI